MADSASCCVLFALVAAATVLPLRWRLRVDESGVSRRLFSRWDVWSWADLSSGLIEKRHPIILYDATRPRWRRKLNLSYMANGDIQAVVSAINTRYRLPAPPEVPAALAITFGFRRSADFDRHGIQVQGRDKPHDYRWEEVYEVHITRIDPVRRDFTSLVIRLPDQTIELKLASNQSGATPMWRGATAEQLNEFLFRLLPSERIRISIAGQPPTERDDILKALNTAEQKARQFRLLTAFFVFSYVLLLIWGTIRGNIVYVLVSGLMLTVYPGSVLLIIGRMYRKQMSDLTEALRKAPP